MVYRYGIPCRANTVFSFLLFLTHLSVRQGNYHVIYSRITALHTSLKWDCIIIPVSSVVTILLFLKKKKKNQILCFWKTKLHCFLLQLATFLCPRYIQAQEPIFTSSFNAWNFLTLSYLTALAKTPQYNAVQKWTREACFFWTREACIFLNQPQGKIFYVFCQDSHLKLSVDTVKK